jgi:hypothetical protein
VCSVLGLLIRKEVRIPEQVREDGVLERAAISNEQTPASIAKKKEKQTLTQEAFFTPVHRLNGTQDRDVLIGLGYSCTKKWNLRLPFAFLIRKELR